MLSEKHLSGMIEKSKNGKACEDEKMEVGSRRIADGFGWNLWRRGILVGKTFFEGGAQ